MNSPISLIPVGVIHAFELLKDDGVFGVYRKVYRDDTGRVSYMIARQPSLKTPTEPPASVLKEYEDETGVLLAFEHWSQLVLPPRVARKRQTPSPYKPAPLNDPEQGGSLRRDPEARGWEISLEELNKRYSPLIMKGHSGFELSGKLNKRFEKVTIYVRKNRPGDLTIGRW